MHMKCVDLQTIWHWMKLITHHLWDHFAVLAVGAKATH